MAKQGGLRALFFYLRVLKGDLAATASDLESWLAGQA
jgi:hypothetical protein